MHNSITYWHICNCAKVIFIVNHNTFVSGCKIHYDEGSKSIFRRSNCPLLKKCIEIFFKDTVRHFASEQMPKTTIYGVKVRFQNLGTVKYRKSKGRPQLPTTEIFITLFSISKLHGMIEYVLFCILILFCN